MPTIKTTAPVTPVAAPVAYDIEAIKNRLNAVTQKKADPNRQNGPKINFWKPEIGEHDVRFLPIKTFNNENEPFQQVLYYEKFCKPRLVAPFQFEQPDPIKDLERELFNEKDRVRRSMLKYLFTKERYYAVLVVRGEEAKGAQLWEISKELCYQIYKTSFIHKNFKNVNLVDADTGHDFTVTVSQKLEKDGSPATFNGFTCKEYVVTPLFQPSKVSDDKAVAKKILETMPDLGAYFKAQVRTPEQIHEILHNFVANLESTGQAVPVETKTRRESTGTDLKKEHGVDSQAEQKAEDEIAKAFSTF